jgi:hypothetical protein
MWNSTIVAIRIMNDNKMCQNYLALPTVTNSTHKQDKRHCKRSVRQDGEKIVIREKKELDPFSPLKSLDHYWLSDN